MHHENSMNQIESWIAMRWVSYGSIWMMTTSTGHTIAWWIPGRKLILSSIHNSCHSSTGRHQWRRSLIFLQQLNRTSGRRRWNLFILFINRGWRLQMIRIPQGNRGKKTNTRVHQVVWMQVHCGRQLTLHGLQNYWCVSSSQLFLFLSPLRFQRGHTSIVIGIG